ncbi:MAG: protein kinase domain-containing protein [Gemmatimonadales bacterium]
MLDPIADLNAALGDRYAVDRELGRGGMATVYLARDLKHERFVALKTLRPEIALALGGERFLREIKLAARLQHPNILAVYDSGDANGMLYYAMPYVEGESLRDRLDREPQLPLEEALQIAREVADALSYAHGHDVVHRDIKPENVMLSGGHAIVADFGIARAISAAGGDKLTETGLAIGTPAYMSPEQAAGTGQVDRRSDIYSLACVLYETLAGQPPFTGPTAQAIMARHSLDSVPRLKIVREAIPDALEAVIKRALAKVPADRYQTAAQFAEALQAASTGPVSPVSLAERPAGRRLWPMALLAVPVIAGLVLLGAALFSDRRAGGGSLGGLDQRRVAVLYFADLSPDSSLGYLADGLTEAVIDELAAVRSLDVISRNGVAPFRHGDLPRDSVARALQAGTLVQGSLEPVGDRVRVAVRLVDGASGVDVRRESFELPAGEALAIRDSLARQVALVLRPRIGDEIRLREQRAGTRSVEAWTLVQRAERVRKDADARLANHDSEGAFARFERADSLLATAESVDGQWAEPALHRGRVAYRRAVLLQREPHAAVPWIQRARTHVERALELTPRDPRALELRGTVGYFEYFINVTPDAAARQGLLDQARQDLEAAVTAEPTLASAHAMLFHLYHRFDDIVSAMLAAQRAYEADEFLANADVILFRLFWGAYDLAQFREARRWCQEGAQRFPRDYRFTECQLWLLVIRDAEPDVAAAWRLAARLDSLAPEHVTPSRRHLGRIVVGGVIGRAGLMDSARHVFERARTADAEADPEHDLPGYEAAMRSVIGDTAEAMTLLQRYVATHPTHSFERGGNIHWWWLPLRDHPGFRSVVRATP